MDREPDELQFLGPLGIVFESFKVLRTCAKLLGAITLTLILPLSFVILAHSLVTEPLFHKIFMHEFFYKMEVGSTAAERTLHQIYLEWGEVMLVEAAYVAFVFAFSLLSTAAVAYTVACLYTAKDLSYARVMSVVPRVWKRLVITFLWFFAVLFSYYVAFVLTFFLWMWISGLNRFKSTMFWVGFAVIATVFFCVHVYISTVWQLASVVSVVEERYGWGAMKKARDLIKGMRATALTLTFFYLLIVGIIEQLFEFGVVRHQVRVQERTVNGVVLVLLLCAVNLMGLLTQTVFYLVCKSCKSYHHESIDKSALSQHLEAYLGEYMPLKDSSIQLENLGP